MTTDNKDNRLSIENSDYAEILRHAVAVIEHARTEIARHVNGYVSTAYWEIGQILHERKIESGYGDSVVRRLSADLKERYPKMGVSPHQLWNMMKFYERYAGHDEKVLRSVALFHHVPRNVHKISSCSKVDVVKHPSSGIVLSGLLTIFLQRCHHTRFQSCAHEVFLYTIPM